MKKGNIIQKVLSYVPDQFIRIEAFNRSKKGNRATTGIIPEANKIRDIGTMEACHYSSYQP